MKRRVKRAFNVLQPFNFQMLYSDKKSRVEKKYKFQMIRNLSIRRRFPTLQSIIHSVKSRAKKKNY